MSQVSRDRKETLTSVTSSSNINSNIKMSNTLDKSSSMESTREWKEGVLTKKEKGIMKSWKERPVILYEGSLFYYQSQHDLTPKGVIHLNNCEIVDVPEKKSKRKFLFTLKTPDSDFTFCARTEEEKMDWVNSIKANAGKRPAPPPDKDFLKKSKSPSTYMSGRFIDSIANLGANGKIIREFATEDTFLIIESVKSFMTLFYNAEKANKAESEAVAIAARVALLYKDKTITKEYFTSLVIPVRLLVSKIIDAYEIPFTLSVPDLVDSIRGVQKAIEQIIRPFLHEKTISKMTEVFDALADEDFLEDFFSKKKHKECQVVGSTLRKLWDSNFF